MNASPGELILFLVTVVGVMVNSWGIWKAWDTIQELKKLKLNGALRYQAVDRIVVMSMLTMMQFVGFGAGVVGIFQAPPDNPGAGINPQAQARISAMVVMSVLCMVLTVWLSLTRNILDALPWHRKREGDRRRA